ncbi:hypothetical protein Nepgr_011165 [Nepenthes gracilis]|uniref:Glutaredoxin domain-containing protein n=1 Tax=Nepenthes gracilis TaxID=150966 RepID=A0AAD3SED6_NEPGR|nr:hypothetical protein Nepgr_011165 [Nepenthes gracilis]
MGCASSKQIGAAAVDVYRPSPASFAVFDINAVEEPWLKLDTNQYQHQEKSSTLLPPPILEKISSFEQQPSDAPRSWEEISKALQDLNKPTVIAATPPKTAAAQPAVTEDAVPPNKTAPRNGLSIHTLDELDTKLLAASKSQTRMHKTESVPPEPTRSDSGMPGSDSETVKPVRENVFILRDRLDREKEGKAANFDRIMANRRDPLSQYPEKCPPGGSDLVVLYTTSLGGVRRTFEDCNRARSVLETHRVVFDERDVSLHAEFLNELRQLVGEGAAVPRLFVKGRYLGGVEEVVELNESGRLGRILSCARVERGLGWQACEGCGGARFVPCLECGGSCKISVGDRRERCPKCNENGLIQCPLCHQNIY